MDAMSWNAPMKPIGSTHKVQQGDWLVTYEVIGWNERTQSNIWAEKKRQYEPHPYLRDVVSDTDVRDMEYIRELRRVVL